jgi:predicted nucleic acid-binding protein
MPEPLRAVDTNVLLRYLLNDIPDQAERARRLIDSDEPIGITPVALAEIAWVLTGPLYRQDQSLVATESVFGN